MKAIRLSNVSVTLYNAKVKLDKGKKYVTWFHKTKSIPFVAIKILGETEAVKKRGYFF